MPVSGFSYASLTEPTRRTVCPAWQVGAVVANSTSIAPPRANVTVAPAGPISCRPSSQSSSHSRVSNSAGSLAVTSATEGEARRRSTPPPCHRRRASTRANGRSAGPPRRPSWPAARPRGRTTCWSRRVPVGFHDAVSTSCSRATPASSPLAYSRQGAKAPPDPAAFTPQRHAPPRTCRRAAHPHDEERWTTCGWDTGAR